MIKNIYLKSSDERAVISLRVKGFDSLTPWYTNQGYQVINRCEFIKLRRRIRAKIKRLIYPIGGIVS
jgi:hypothetical protein